MSKPDAAASLRRGIFFAGAIFGVVMVTLLIAETIDIVAAARQLDPSFGTTVLVAFIMLYAAIIGTPVWFMLTRPQPLKLPDPDDTDAVADYRFALTRRLAKNPILKRADVPVSTAADLSVALEHLDVLSARYIRSTARAVFATTAISQSSKVDGVVVLSTQVRMIWRIAHVYNQHPTLTDLARLYANVATATFIAVQIEELDLEEQLEPLFNVILGSAVGTVPGLAAIADIVVASILSGGANAFLTLRVGLAAQRYCGATSQPHPRIVRRESTHEAARQLSGVVKGIRPVLKSIVQLFGKSTKRFFSRKTSQTVSHVQDLFSRRAAANPEEDRSSSE